jgi:hypothetical protein
MKILAWVPLEKFQKKIPTDIQGNFIPNYVFGASRTIFFMNHLKFDQLKIRKIKKEILN